MPQHMTNLNEHALAMPANLVVNERRNVTANVQHVDAARTQALAATMDLGRVGGSASMPILFLPVLQLVYPVLLDTSACRFGCSCTSY